MSIPSKKILFVVPRYHTNMIPMAEALTLHGHKVYIIGKYEIMHEKKDLIKHICLDPKVVTKKDLEWEIEKIKPDVMIVRETEGIFTHAAKIGRKNGAKVLFYNQSPYLCNQKLTSLVKDILKLCKRIVQGQPLQRITPVRGSYPGRPSMYSKYLPFPMPLSEITKNKEYFRSGVPIILCVGTLFKPRKRHIMLINALEELQVDCKLLIAGDKLKNLPEKKIKELGADKIQEFKQYYEKLLKQCSEPKLLKKVEVSILEDIPYMKMIDLYYLTDIFVLPSKDEPFAISPIEAMASGCAVITSNTNGSSGYITHQKDGMIFNVNDYNDFLSILYKLISSKDIVESLGTEARRTIQKNHNYTGFVKSLFEISGF